MSIRFIACTPIAAVQVQVAVGIPSIAAWLTVSGAAVFAPPVVGLLGFSASRDSWGDLAAVVFLVLFLTALLAARKLYRSAISC
jgi:hypothetical protein